MSLSLTRFYQHVPRCDSRKQVALECLEFAELIILGNGGGGLERSPPPPFPPPPPPPKLEPTGTPPPQSRHWEG